jgi:hypothetical protein
MDGNALFCVIWLCTVFFGNVTTTLKRGLNCKNTTQKIKPAVKSEYNPLLPWPCENIVLY